MLLDKYNTDHFTLTGQFYGKIIGVVAGDAYHFYGNRTGNFAEKFLYHANALATAENKNWLWTQAA